MSNNYTGLRTLPDKKKLGDQPASQRCAERLLAMRDRLAPIRDRKGDGTLLLATWNIRDFDSNQYKFGPRLPESFYYIAEVISCFDLVAVQEVNRDLTALETVMRILGRDWDYLVTDTTEGKGGNGERMAFVFNTEKVWFRKIAGEVVLPEGQLVVPKAKVKPPDEQPVALAETGATAAPGQQFARTPFLVAFQAGWFRFSLCTVHIYYGRDTGARLRRRIAEIERLVEFFAKRQDRENKGRQGSQLGAAENYILLGDFNVVSPEHETMEALTSHGFTVPEAIQGDAVGERDNFYDQIAVRVKDPRFKVTGGGILNLYEDVFRDTEEDRARYKPVVPAKDTEDDADFVATSPEALYRKWRTWQMSDHHPLWIEIATDFTEHYLEEIAAPTD